PSDDRELCCVFQIDDRTADVPMTVGYVGEGEQIALIPDLYFWMDKGYLHQREAFREHWLPWSDSARQVFCRGSSTGAEKITMSSLADLPRFRLCAAGANGGYLHGTLDAKLTNIVQASSADEAESMRTFVEKKGLLSVQVPQIDFLRY